MNIFKVSSLPIRNVISDIAKELDTDYSKSCGIFKVKIPASFGRGIIEGTDFNDGLAMIRYDCEFLKDTEIRYSVDKVHPLKFLFCMGGQIRHKFLDESKWHNIPHYKNAMIASSQHYGHCVRLLAGERLVYYSLELDRRKFQGKITCEPNNVSATWMSMLNDVSAKKTFYHEGFYSLQLSGIFEEWDTYTDKDWLKKLHLEGLAYKILILQINQFQDDAKSEGNKTMLRKSELNQLIKAVKIIENQLEDLPTINQIASEVGLNANKLQQGFKEIFDKTANEYIREKRLESARILLLNTDQTITAITSMVGFKSHSYLSKIFLRTYGVKPSEFRRNREVKKIVPEYLFDET